TTSSSATSQARCDAFGSASCRGTGCGASCRPTTSTGRGSSTATAEPPIAERSLIESIAAALEAGSDPVAGEGPERLWHGLGDDAAVVRARPFAVTSVDAVVEGVHFRLQPGWASPADVGHRALAQALSDLAAMGARAGEAYLVLGLPGHVGEPDALELVG